MFSGISLTNVPVVSSAVYVGSRVRCVHALFFLEGLLPMYEDRGGSFEERPLRPDRERAVEMDWRGLCSPRAGATRLC